MEVLFNYVVVNYPGTDCDGMAPDMFLRTPEEIEPLARQIFNEWDESEEDEDADFPYIGHLKVYMNGTFEFVPFNFERGQDRVEDEDDE